MSTTPPLLLLPGMMCDRRLWQPQQAALTAQQVEVQIGDLGGANSIDALASRLLVRAPRRFALAGFGLGGMVALALWREAPHRIDRLALLGTDYRSDSPEQRAVRNSQLQAVQRGDLSQVLRERLKPEHQGMAERNHLALFSDMLKMGNSLGPELFTSQTIALRDRPDSEATLAGIDCPTLVLCGAEDAICAPELQREMALRIPHADLVTVPRCGHLSTLEQPDAVSFALGEWLAAG